MFEKTKLMKKRPGLPIFKKIECWALEGAKIETNECPQNMDIDIVEAAGRRQTNLNFLWKSFFFPKSGSASVSAYKKNPIRSVDEFQSHRQKSLRLPGLLLWTNLALSSFAQSWFCSRAATTTTTMTWPLNLNTSDEYEGIIIIDLWPMLLSLYCNKTRFSNYSC